MAYATLSNVLALTPKRVFSATSIPNAAQVAEYLDNGAADIDSILGGDGYAVPVPASASIALLNLRRLNAIAAWVQVEHSAQVPSPDAPRAEKMWAAARKELVSGDVQLIDAPRLGGENFARSMSAATPFFTRDMAL